MRGLAGKVQHDSTKTEKHALELCDMGVSEIWGTVSGSLNKEKPETPKTLNPTPKTLNPPNCRVCGLGFRV